MAASILALLAVLATTLRTPAPGPAAQDPSQSDEKALYPSSVVGTDFDFILETDPDLFTALEYKGQSKPEMPDKTKPSAPLHKPAFMFESRFRDGTSIALAIDAEFKTEEEARKEALRYTPRLGKLPAPLRGGVSRVVVHKGGADATAFSDVGLIVLYSDNATRRIATHDLEETVFHEAVHASWDKAHRESPGWRAAQKKDGRFVTEYARKNPDGEDLAESALFAYTLLHYPDRIPKEEAARIRGAIPARIAFVGTLVPPCQVDLTQVGQLRDILSNALILGLGQDEGKVRSYLNAAKDLYTDPEMLMNAAMNRFGIDKKELREQVRKYHHCNCKHRELEPAPARDQR